MGKYELFYQKGGHGGPYPSLEEAIETARRFLRGNVRERRIDVRPYSATAPSGFGPTEVVVRVMDIHDVDPDAIVVEQIPSRRKRV